MNKYESLLLNIFSKESSITPFGNLDPSYLWTNEDMSLYPKENLKDKKVLTITSSGDHALNCVLNGATNIASFDVNIFSKYVSALKIAMIKKYNYYDFFKRMRFIEEMETFNYNFKDNIIFGVKEYLTMDEYKFWDTFEYLRINNKISYGDVINPYGNIKYNNYIDLLQYQKLKKNLKNVNFKYYDTDIINIKNSINEEFDRVFLSNVLEYVLCSNTPNFTKNYHEVLNGLDKILKVNAIIYGYDFNFISKYEDEMPSNLSYNYNEIIKKKNNACKQKVFSLSKV